MGKKRIYNNKQTMSIFSLITNGTQVNYYIKYTAAFIFIFTISYSWWFRNEKSFVWNADAIEQHYVALVYYGRYLKQIVSDLFTQGKIIIPMFDFSIGYGSDIPTTLHYYVFGDPLNLLAVFAVDEKMELLYGFLIFFRVYLSGIAFSLYCDYMKKPGFHTLCGAFIYAFCGFTMFAAVRHPYFINPMIYLPLLLLGAEKILAKQRPHLFIVMVCISAVSNFYFFYMLIVFTVIYVAIRFFAIYKNDIIKNLLYWLSRFSLFFATGLLISCILFLPCVMVLLFGNRMDINNAVDLFYKFSYYETFVAIFITQKYPGYWTVMGYSAVSLIAVILLFTKTRKDGKSYSQLKIGFILLTVCLLSPVAGHILHGFSYVSNRWIWAYSFLIAFISVTIMPDMFKPSKRQMRAVIAFAAVYLLYGLLFKSVRSEEFFMSSSILLMVIVFITNNQFENHENNEKDKQSQNKLTSPDFIKKASILSLIAVGIFVQAFYRFSPDKGNYVAQFVNKGEAFSKQTNTTSDLIRRLNDNSFFRYENNVFGGQYTIQNSAMLNRQNSTDFYFSLISPYITEYLLDDINKYGVNVNNHYGLESRAMPAALAGVKYFIIKPGLERFLPYGYDEMVSQKDEYHIYKNKYSLPMGYTYDNVISEILYKNMSPIERQQALLQSAVVNDEADKIVKSVYPTFSHSILPYEMEFSDDEISYENGTFTVNNTESSVKLIFDGIKESETYLSILNMHFSQTNPIGDDEGHWGTLDDKEKRKFAWENRSWTAAETATVKINSGNIGRSFVIKAPHHQFYGGQHDFIFNLFYSEEKKTEIELTFSVKGNYSIDALNVICQPMNSLEPQIEKLRETVLENVEIGINRVSGTITAVQTQLLCFSIPYNGGWSAYINGEKTKMLRVNTMYNGVYLPPGQHDIVLKYTTPYMKVGGALTIIGLVLFAVIIIKYKKVGVI